MTVYKRVDPRWKLAEFPDEWKLAEFPDEIELKDPDDYAIIQLGVNGYTFVMYHGKRPQQLKVLNDEACHEWQPSGLRLLTLPRE